MFKYIVGLALLACLAARPARAEDGASSTLAPELHEAVVWVPVAAGVNLAVTLCRPNGAGPFPLAIILHGKNAEDPRVATRNREIYLTRYFVQRGYAVALPMLRGFNRSGGVFRGTCDVAAEGRIQARDVAALITQLGRRRGIDASRVVVCGQSWGGWNTLAVGALGLPQVKGLVSFAGGRQAVGCLDWPETLARAAGAFAVTTRAPALWFYGSNDSLFPPAVWRNIRRHYQAGGARVQAVEVGVFEKDSHHLLGSVVGLNAWVPPLDAFLAGLGLPTRVLDGSLLPALYPKPTGFASAFDAGALPTLRPDARNEYRRFLQAPMPRVCLLSSDGRVTWGSGGYDTLATARAAAVKQGLDSRPYAIDDQVVWTPPPAGWAKAAAPAAPQAQGSAYADLWDVKAVPYVNDEGRRRYQAFLGSPKPRAVVLDRHGSLVVAVGGADPLARALAECKKHGLNCRPYAVDDQVLWKGKTP